MSEKTFVVIGSNSFSGGWMVDTLLADDANNKVIGVSRSAEKSELFLPYKFKHSQNFKFYQLDINRDTARLFELLDRLQPAYIINFAAQGEVGTSWKYPEQWFQTNVLGIVKLTNFLKDKKYLKRYIHISTPEVYGSCDQMTEKNAVMDPSTPYAASKAAADLFISTLIKQYQFPAITIRSTNVYGKHQQLYRIIPRTIIYLKMGKKIQLHGGGNAIKSYIHIKDVCEGILAALKSGKAGEVYHLSPDKSISIRELVATLCELMGYDFTKMTETVSDRPGQDAYYIIDSTKARTEFSWQPKIELSQGLREMIHWIGGAYQQIIKEPLEYVHLS